MKRISKKPEPEFFKHCAGSNKGWRDFIGTNEHSKLLEYLIDEQDGLCCYCEKKITNNSDAHIEHFKPQSTHPDGIYNYDNLHASCNGKKGKADSCGHKKGADFDGLISPLDHDCEQRFTYTLRGKIIPSNENDNDAKNTIKVLGLNCQRLVSLRSTIIKYISEGISNEDLEQILDTEHFKKFPFPTLLDWRTKKLDSLN